MRVGVHCKSHAGMPQSLTNYLGLGSREQHETSEGMAKVMKPHTFQSGFPANLTKGMSKYVFTFSYLKYVENLSYESVYADTFLFI